MESINLQLLNKVGELWNLEFGENQDGQVWVVPKGGGDTLDQFENTNEAFIWFKGYEKGWSDGSPDQKLPSTDDASAF